VIHLNERECSAQRRYQKVLEESPSPFLTPELRGAMGEAAIKSGHAIDYQNAGTVEFIVGQDGQFYFMEINTRLQVEHPVTELVTGLDLVEWQLRVAAGEPLPRTQDGIYSSGHAIEVRLYAEDPDAGFLPGSGTLTRLRLPEFMPDVRIDSGVVEGDTVTIFYDPMIAKLIVFGVDRARALARLREALAACEIEGPKSNIVFLERLARHPAVVGGTIDTGYLDRHLDEFIGGAGSESESHVQRALTAAVLRLREARNDSASPWDVRDGWRLDGDGATPIRLQDGDVDAQLSISGSGGDYIVREGDALTYLEGLRLTGEVLSGRVNGRARRLQARSDGDVVTLHDGERRHRLQRTALHRLEDEAGGGSGDRVKAPMPGRVVLVKARAGDEVKADDVLMVMEAMKMELALKAPRDGIVADVQACEGDFVEADATLVTLEH